MRQAGFRHRFPDVADELPRQGAVLPVVHTLTGVDVDIVLAGSGLERIALDRAEPMAIDGVVVPVASATDLLVMKVFAGRGKDLDDAALLRCADVDMEEARALLGELEEALGVSDLLSRLDRLVG